MVKLVDSRGLLTPHCPRSIKQRVSLYAGDVVVFLSQVVLDLVMIKEILELFRRATGLATNLNKSKAFPIRCAEVQLDLITHTLGCECTDFPCTYLGVPLSPWRLPKSAMQSVVDKVARRLPPWKGRILTQSGHLILARSTLCAILVHISMAIRITTWAIQAIEKLVYGFLWCGSEVVVGGNVQLLGSMWLALGSMVVLASQTFSLWASLYVFVGCGWLGSTLTRLGRSMLFGSMGRQRSSSMPL
jgi:hypothetical protein